MAPTSLVAKHRYTALCTSCLYMAGGNGSKASVPLDMSCRRDRTSDTGVPSAVSHRMCGAGCPAAVQSIHAPVVFENSYLPGGSSRNDGPVKSDDDIDGTCNGNAVIIRKRNWQLVLVGWKSIDEWVKRRIVAVPVKKTLIIKNYNFFEKRFALRDFVDSGSSHLENHEVRETRFTKLSVTGK